MADKVNEQIVERDLEQVEEIFSLAWRNNLATTEALLERLRVQILISQPSRRRRASAAGLPSP